METIEWKKWCRLCGKNNGSDVDATLKLKNTETLAENIKKYFGILISDSDICTKICNECNNTINLIVKYNSHVLKVNGMFLELEKSYLNENINLSSLRKKHGLNNNINGISDSEMHETDVGLVKADVKSTTLNNSPSAVKMKPCKVIIKKFSFKSKSEDNSTTKQTEIGKVITHSTDVKSKPLNNSLPPPCFLEMEIGDVTDVDLENLLSSSESNDELPLAHVKSKTLNNSPPPVDVKSCKVIEYNDISFKSKPEDNSTTKQTEIDKAIELPTENFSVVFPFGLNDLDEVNLRCRYCNKNFHKKDSLIEHTKNHFNYILTCNICKKHFCSKQKIQRHNKTHLTDVKSKTLSNSLAPPCLIETEIGDVTDLNLENSVSSFESNDVLPNECVNEHEMQQQTNIKQGGDDNINLNQEAETPNENEKFFDCNICQKRFTFRGKTKHMRKHFAKKDIAQNPFPFQCRVCGKSCKNLHVLRRHEPVHLPRNERKTYECSYCKKKYKDESAFKCHVRFLHKKKGSLMCEFCGQAFATNTVLKGHMLIHSEEKKFKCSKCGKTFKRPSCLKEHMDTHEHTEYPCKICGLKLKTRKTLRAHMLVHSNENKYKCNICSRQFKRLEQFKLHLMSHLNLKPFECFICNVSFKTQPTCRLHQKTKHPVELAAADLTDKPKTSKNVPSMKYLYEYNEKALCTSK